MNGATTTLDAAPPTNSGGAAFAAGMRRIGELIAEIEQGSDPALREQARRLTQALLDVHREGLARIWEIVEEQGAAADDVRRALPADPLVGNLLVLHDLHPVDRATRVEQGLEKARLRLRPQGLDVFASAVGPETVHLRLVGGCDGCPSSARALEKIVEDALCETAADAGAVVWEPRPTDGDASSGRGFVPLEALAGSRSRPPEGP